MKLSTRYEQTSCRLVLEGLPDLSAGQSGDNLGILTGFSLELAGRPQLEGKREHLEALMAVVLAYARHLLSGQARPFGSDDAPVAIEPGDDGHRLELRSSQPDTPPLQLQLDDAELADLVRCLDQLRFDPRIGMPFELTAPRPLRRYELRRRQPLRQVLAAPLAGLGILAVAAALIALIPPTPRPAPSAPPAGTSAPSAPSR
jgi:hypothetical protein